MTRHFAILLTSLLLSFNAMASVNYHFTSAFGFFKQDATNENALPQSLNKPVALQIQFSVEETDSAQIKKVFEQILKINNLQVKIEIFYFNNKNGKYFSQQLILSKDSKIISKCTAYFDKQQNYLVPGACSARDNDTFWGVSVYKI